MPPGYLAICVNSSREKRATSRDEQFSFVAQFIQIVVFRFAGFRMAKIVFLIGFKSVYVAVIHRMTNKSISIKFAWKK